MLRCIGELCYEQNSGLLCIILSFAGEMQCSHSSMTVTHSTGQYTLQLFDRVQIRIVVRANHSHAHTLTFNLISCGPVIHSVERSTGQKDIVKVCMYVYIRVLKVECLYYIHVYKHN